MGYAYKENTDRWPTKEQKRAASKTLDELDKAQEMALNKVIDSDINDGNLYDKLSDLRNLNIKRMIYDKESPHEFNYIPD